MLMPQHPSCIYSALPFAFEEGSTGWSLAVVHQHPASGARHEQGQAQGAVGFTSPVVVDITPTESNISSAVIRFQRSVICGYLGAFLKVISVTQFSENIIS